MREKPHKDARSSSPVTSLTVSTQVVNVLGQQTMREGAGRDSGGSGTGGRAIAPHDTGN